MHGEVHVNKLSLDDALLVVGRLLLPNFTIHRLITKEGDLKYDKKEESESNDLIFLIIKTCQPTLL